MGKFQSTKIIDLGSCAFRQPRASSHCKWVVDFGGLKPLKKRLEHQFDHTTCIAADDPLVKEFAFLQEKGAIDLRIMENGVGIERTAEWCHKAANDFLNDSTGGRCICVKVEVWEHEGNSAIYEG